MTTPDNRDARTGESMGANDPSVSTDENMSDERAQEIAAEQTASTSENADEAGKDWEGRDVDAPAPGPESS